MDGPTRAMGNGILPCFGEIDLMWSEGNQMTLL